MNARILWADDEIDLLKPHILFLKDKGFEVDTATSGDDALDLCDENPYDLVFLDENMPGISGLEALSKIKAKRPNLPVIMITKSEEESIMEEAIGSKISDYLIKPVNPNQILLSIKKNLDSKRLVGEKATTGYQVQFREIMMELGGRLSAEDWVELYRKLMYWELELEQSTEASMKEIFQQQKVEANQQFAKFVEDEYVDWLEYETEGRPMQSHRIIKDWTLPLIKESDNVYMMVIDNLRYDQWMVLKSIITEDFRVKDEQAFYSILPTATQYARNALFAGLMPSEIKKRYPKWWREENDEGSKNQFEAELLGENLRRNGYHGKVGYHKITNLDAGKKLVDNFSNLDQNDFNVIVYNFVDMLSHARTDMAVIKELADDESAYRSLTISWFEHSPLRDMMRKIKETGGKMVITTDHGTVKVNNPVKVVGDRETNTNLRYKIGRNLSYDSREVFEVRNPDDVYLPKTNVSSTYIFTKDNDFLVYPNNYNKFVKLYGDSFQHGGISLEEMIIPYIVLEPK